MFLNSWDRMEAEKKNVIYFQGIVRGGTFFFSVRIIFKGVVEIKFAQFSCNPKFRLGHVRV